MIWNMVYLGPWYRHLNGIEDRASWKPESEMPSSALLPLSCFTSQRRNVSSLKNSQLLYVSEKTET